MFRKTIPTLIFASIAGLLLTGAASPIEAVSSDNDTLQWLINALFTIAGVLGGWLLTIFHQTMKDLQKFDFELAEKVHAIELLVAGQYVKKDELQALSVALFSKLDRIEQKLDQKADKALI